VGTHRPRRRAEGVPTITANHQTHRTMNTNNVKTWTLMAALAGLLVFVGYAVGGSRLALVALAVATIMNVAVYWTSDSLALRAAGARELRPGELPEVRRIVADLARRAGIPVPRLYVIERPEPNAFATGRDPHHAAVAVTTGLLEIMDERQLAGVLAHELSHVRNRDTLVGTVAATIAGAVSFIAQMLQFQLWFGGSDEDRPNPIGALAAILLAPLAAMIIQLAVSRAREYGADASGAELTGDPEGLAQALERLDAANRRPSFGGWFGRRAEPTPAPNPAFAHLYIVNPLRGADLATLFSTHPPIAERVARLRRIARGAGWTR
jgi:heat shock protein HtpX